MNNDEAILIELRKISSFSELQRKWMRYSLVFAAAFCPLILGFMILVPKWAESKMRETFPESSSDWYDVSRNTQLGSFETAIEIGEALLLKTPDYPHAHTTLAGAYLAAGQLEQAHNHYEEAARLFPSSHNKDNLSAITERLSVERGQTRDRATTDAASPVTTEADNE